MDEMVWDPVWCKWVYPDILWQRRAADQAWLHTIREEVFPDMSEDEILMDEEEEDNGL